VCVCVCVCVWWARKSINFNDSNIPTKSHLRGEIPRLGWGNHVTQLLLPKFISIEYLVEGSIYPC
jgi:hypothetical protein